MEKIKFRSLLWTSGLSTEKYHKAQNASADISIIDYEDSVPFEKKSSARKLSLEYLKSQKGISKGIRMNGVMTKDGLEDLLFLIEHTLSLDLLVIPKVDSADEIILVEKILSNAGITPKICATIETLKGLLNVEKIAMVSKNLIAIIFGAADFSSELGVEISWDSLIHARSKIVYAAARAKILSLDAPCFELNNLNALRQQSNASKNLGFAGMAALHPNQVSIINSTFSPSLKEIKWAKKVIKLTNGLCNKIGIVDNCMVGPPFIMRAERILAYANLL